MGYRESDIGRVFENAVYLRLLHDGWSVSVGKLYQKEVDFVCLREGKVLYVQAVDSMMDEATRERELAPLRSIADNHEKWVVVRQGNYPHEIDGIRIVRAALLLVQRSFRCFPYRHLASSSVISLSRWVIKRR